MNKLGNWNCGSFNYPKTAAALMVGPANTKSTSQPRFK